ncbi:serpin B9-like protein [Dinothrombium tinctorium]|uniref:Serpin B9-like protein n=1 Tax=Dinothrombium tinctorium TaxID=1965070 RepID=A0A3S3P5N5_9ACAR|nr:serpin B9-like protein [Dinothrombium tinctorium]
MHSGYCQQPENAKAVNAINSFTFKIFNELRDLNQTENTFYSPLGIASTMAILLLGSGHSQANELFRVLNAENAFKSPQEMHEAFQMFLTRMRDEKKYELNIVNGLVVSDHVNISEQFRKNLKQYYGSTIEKTDFTDRNAVKAINLWFAQLTSNRFLQSLSALDPFTKILAFNAVYFKGKWLSKFPNDLTKKRRFDFDGPGFKDIPFMSIQDTYGFLRNKKKQYRMLEMKYDGNLDFVIILPYKRIGLHKVMQSLTVEDLFSTKTLQRKYELYLPKFRLESQFDMVRVMPKVGVSKVFHEGADFSAIAEKTKLKVSQGIHEAMIDVDEEGLISEATTGIFILHKKYVPRFIINHPFMFYVRNRQNNLIYFIGCIHKP